MPSETGADQLKVAGTSLLISRQAITLSMREAIVVGGPLFCNLHMCPNESKISALLRTEGSVQEKIDSNDYIGKFSDGAWSILSVVKKIDSETFLLRHKKMGAHLLVIV